MDRKRKFAELKYYTPQCNVEKFINTNLPLVRLIQSSTDDMDHKRCKQQYTGNCKEGTVRMEKEILRDASNMILKLTVFMVAFGTFGSTSVLSMKAWLLKRNHG